MTVTDADHVPVAVTAIQVTGTQRPNLFTARVNNVGDVRVDVPISGLGVLLPGPATYTDTLTITAGGQTASVTLTLQIGTHLTFSPSATSLSFVAALGTTSPLPSQFVTLAPPGVQVSYTTSVSTTSGGTWLSVFPASSDTVTTPQLTITANPNLLAMGTYTGSVLVNPAGLAPVTIQVSLGVGTSGSLTVNPAGLAFAYNTATGTVPSPQSVAVASTASSYGAVASSVGNWLFVNGALATSGTFLNNPALSVGLNPAALPVLTTGTYQGTVTVNDGSSQQIVQVTLSVNSAIGVTISPTTLTFSSPGGVQPSSQTIGISSTQTGLTYAATAASSAGWLTVSLNSVSVPGTVFVDANPTNLGIGSYLGQVVVTVSNGATLVATQVVTVNLTVGSGGVTTVTTAAPPSLTFYVLRGGGSTLPQTIAIAGPANQAIAVTPVNTIAGGGNWLTVSSASQAVPGVATVGIDPTVAGALPTGTYSGSVQISSNTGNPTIPVSLIVAPGTASLIVANPASLTLAYNFTTGQAPGLQYISLSGPAVSTVISSVSWLTVIPGNPIMIFPSGAGLPAGLNSGTITVTAPGADNNPLTIPVTVNIIGSGLLTVSPQSLTFTATQGSSPVPNSQTVSLSTASSVLYTAAASSTGNWLSVSPASGIAPNSVTVSVNSAALTVGTYTGTMTLTLTATGVTQQIPVTLVVGGGVIATLSVDATAVNFDYQQGGRVPDAKSFLVTSTGTQVSITASAVTTDGGSWLTVTPAATMTSASLAIGVNPDGLAAGTYTGTIAVASTAASNSPQTKTVTLTVRPAGVLTLGNNTLTFTSRAGATPAPQTVSAASSGDPISFTVTTTGGSWLTVTPASGSTPATLTVSANPAGLATGQTYTGQITLQSTGGTTTSQTIAVSFNAAAPLPTITDVQSAASYAAGVVAPGEMVVLLGSYMGPNDLAQLTLDSSGNASTTLAGVQVLFNGFPSPLVYASATKVAVVVPYEIAGRTSTTVQLKYNGSASNSVSMDVASTVPGIFTVNASGTGQGSILNGDYTLNGAANPAAPGSLVIVYATGEGQTAPLGVTGKVYSDPKSLPQPVLFVTATIGGEPATVTYSGEVQGLVSGVMQVNVLVPLTATAGPAVPLTISVGTARSNTVTMAVKSTTTAPACVTFPANFVPFTSVAYVSNPNAAGDRLLVGSILLPGSSFANYTTIQNLSLPSGPNQQFCGNVQLANGYSVVAYVPTAAERVGDFSAFGGVLTDPLANLPFPGGIIPASRIGSTFAWRIAAVR